MENNYHPIEVVYATPERQCVISLKVAKNCSVRDAILQSNILNQFDSLSLETLKVGKFSRQCQLSDLTEAGDRIEIYRPLIRDPKDNRKQRARKQKGR